MDKWDERAKEVSIRMAQASAERSEPFTNMTDIIAAALREAVADEREECAKLCDDERLRQIKGDKFDRMNGQDTAFGLSQAIRARAEQEGRG